VTAEAVTIETLTAGGAGLGHLEDGMAVFVPRTAPGDRVRLKAPRRHRRHAEAEVDELLEPGPGRVEPPCRHFVRDRCGGCQWQHVAPDVQVAAKRRLVGDALRRIGHLDVTDPELVGSPRPLGYRTSITLTARRRGGAPLVGFHDGAEPDRVFPLERCEIARPELQALWQAVRGSLDCLPRGEDVRCKLRVTEGGALHVMVDGGERAWTDGEPIAAAARAAGFDPTIWWQPHGGAARRIAGRAAEGAGLAFEQVNAELAALLHGAVVEAALEATAAQERRTVLDLYAGGGETAIPLAAAQREVALVEVDAAAVRRAQQRAASAGVSVRCIAGKVEDWLPGLLPADVVIVNPPRSGLSAEAAERLFGTPPERLVYVSCDPATLARDLGRLGIGAGQLRTLRAYDMFPQTSHVEVLVVADRMNG
jgi:23S rRNA (uracil1939-C5)-methyltransferase